MRVNAKKITCKTKKTKTTVSYMRQQTAKVRQGWRRKWAGQPVQVCAMEFWQFSLGPFILSCNATCNLQLAWNSMGSEESAIAPFLCSLDFPCYFKRYKLQVAFQLSMNRPLVYSSFFSNSLFQRLYPYKVNWWYGSCWGVRSSCWGHFW